jgi:hypothetical protein
MNKPPVVSNVIDFFRVSNEFSWLQLRLVNHAADIRSSSPDSINDTIVESKSSVYNQSFLTGI